MNFDEFIVDEPQFNESIKGTFGSFHTAASYPVNYLLTSMNYRELASLEVAAEAFEFSQVKFDELVQREIDVHRVNNEIVSEYLEKDVNTALFFPPIIVSVVGFDEQNNPIHKYEDSKEEIDSSKKVNIFQKTWDRHFQLELPISSSGFDEYFSENHGEIKIYKHWGGLNYNRDLVKFVVIDGQHRFKAIKEYWERHPEQKKFLNIPVCICFSPKAIEKNGPEDILDTLRNMFVTINNTGKKVSGHYIDLLNDQSLASQTVRIIADKWKQESTDPLNSLLQHLEWNQRADSKSRRVNRTYSITTVSMLCESLKKSVFLSNDKETSLYNLLNLKDYKEILEADGSSIHNITESDFTHSQRTALGNIINERLIPSLEVLLTRPRVFSKKIETYRSAVSICTDKANKSEPGYKTLVKQLNIFNDVDPKLHTEESIKASQYFYSLIADGEHLENYTRLVFNQAYLRVWAKIADSHIVFRSNLLEFTKVFVDSLEVLAFNENKMVFSKSRIYNQHTLYKGGKPNTTNLGKDAWFNLLMSTYLDRNQLRAIEDWLASKEGGAQALTKLVELIEMSKINFVETINQQLIKDFKQNWKMKDLPLSFRNELEALETGGELIKLEELLADRTKEQLQIRLELISNILGRQQSIFAQFEE